MTLESARAFYSDVKSGKIQLDLGKMIGPDHADAMAYAHSHGYDFTESEMLEVLSHQGSAITMEEAEAIAGGITADEFTTCMTVGTAVANIAAAACA